MSIMNRVAAKFAMDARSDPRRIAVACSQGERQRRRANLVQRPGALALRAVGCVARLAKGATATRYRVAAACGSSRQLATPAPEGCAPPCCGCAIRRTSRLAVSSRHVTDKTTSHSTRPSKDDDQVAGYAQQPIAGARAGRPSRTKHYAPPCPACNPAKPGARSCRTYSEAPYVG
jgi:hypothetical protein